MRLTNRRKLLIMPPLPLCTIAFNGLIIGQTSHRMAVFGLIFNALPLGIFITAAPFTPDI